MIGKIFKEIQGAGEKPQFCGKAVINDSEVRSFGVLNVISDVRIEVKSGIRYFVWVDGKAADLLWPIKNFEEISVGEDRVKQEGMFRYRFSMDELPDD